MRSPNRGQVTFTVTNELLDRIKIRLPEIDTFQSFKAAYKLYRNDLLIIKKLDDLLIKATNKLQSQDWIELLNTKSILRQRNLTVLETIAYTVINKTNQGEINMDMKSFFETAS